MRWDISRGDEGTVAVLCWEKADWMKTMMESWLRYVLTSRYDGHSSNIQNDNSLLFYHVPIGYLSVGSET